MPAPSATGDARLAILKHALSLKDTTVEHPTPAGVELAIRNTSDADIATIVFETTFYDRAGTIVDTVKHREVELASQTSRALRINSTIPLTESNRVNSYKVQVIRTTTAEQEPVQIRRHELRTTQAGEHVWGIVKNIGEVKTDAAVVWSFYDPNKEIIGTNVVILRGIEPKTIRPYDFTFKPQDGETVRTYSIAVGKIAAEAEHTRRADC